MALEKEKQILQLLEDAYFGTGGFEFCLPQVGNRITDPDAVPVSMVFSYLIRHMRETPEKFNARVALANYLNYMAPVVDSHVQPLFRREATRTGKASAQALWDAFQEDADGSGQSLANVMSEAAFPAKRDGIHILVVTSPPVKPGTVAEALKTRPYIYGVHALDITDLQRDKKRNIVSISHIDSHEGEKDPVTRTITATGWEVKRDSGEVIDSGNFATPYKTAPVVELAPGLTIRGHMLPRSEFVAIARCCHRLFNLCSELDEIIRNQTFSILTYPAKSVDDLTLGTNNVLGYDPEYKMAPEFKAPPDGPAKVVMEQFDRLVREIYRMSLLTHQTGSTSKTGTQNLPSGLALKIDRESLDTALSEFASVLEKAERDIASIWAWWTGETISYEVAYPRDFTLQDMATELQPLLDAWTSIVSSAPKLLQAGMLLRIADLIFEGDEKRLKEITTAIEEWAKEPTPDPPKITVPGQGDVGNPPQNDQSTSPVV